MFHITPVLSYYQQEFSAMIEMFCDCTDMCMVATGHTWLLGTSNGAAAAAKLLQSCPTLCDPIDGSHQAPPSLGFSRQEHWSGLPFPSPMHESEK